MLVGMTNYCTFACISVRYFTYTQARVAVVTSKLYTVWRAISLSSVKVTFGISFNSHLQADDDLYIPRSILIDLEPRVIQGILSGPQKSLYNRENTYIGTTGAGAGNLWAAGYMRETKEIDKIMDMINREADNSDSLEVRMT